MDNRAIGVFDSGLGGLSAVKRLMDMAPCEDIIFFGDNARVPYGNRGASTITRFSLEDISLLLTHNVKMIIAACGTVSSTLSPDYADLIHLPFVSVVTPAAIAAAAVTRNRRVGVIGTAATIRSGSFSRALHHIDPLIKPVCQPCPLLVPLVENGYIQRDNAVTRSVASDYLRSLLDEGVDTLILGCTHYPIIADIIQDIMGDVVLIDSGTEVVRSALALLDETGSRNDAGGSTAFYVSDSPDGFTGVAEMFLGHTLSSPVHLISLDDLHIDPCFRRQS